MLEEKASFTKEDFITLFHSYDEYQTTVLQADNLSMYSPQGAALLMQGGAKTVLYAAMYCEGKYTGAISYVTCREKRYWTRQNRKKLGEVTRIISAHLARTLTPAGSEEGPIDMVEYDSLTGLMSFSRFRIELERLIIGNYVASSYLLYIDFADFKFFNQKYGYSQGDRVLKEFCNFVIQKLESEIRDEICDAFREKRFEIFLQPKYSLTTNDVTGAEAFVHWRTEDGRLLAPISSFPCANRQGLSKSSISTFSSGWRNSWPKTSARPSSWSAS